MKCKNFWCIDHARNNEYCKSCNKISGKGHCYVKNCKNKLNKNFRCILHLNYNSILIERDFGIIYYDCVTPFIKINKCKRLFIDIDININFYLYYSSPEGFYIFDINGCLFPGQKEYIIPYGDLYGPIILKNKLFRETESLDKLFVCLIKSNNVKEHIIKNNNAIIIQKAWRKCRYDPSYKMCSKVQLGELERLGAF